MTNGGAAAFGALALAAVAGTPPVGKAANERGHHYQETLIDIVTC
jgi:hypothetical protein